MGWGWFCHTPNSEFLMDIYPQDKIPKLGGELMDYNISRKVRFSRNPEYSSLYKWCLHDVHEDGKNDGDMIPWVWSLFFTATSLKVNRTIAFKSEPIENNFDNRKNDTSEDCSITGQLFSGWCIDGKNLDRYVSYSMFGTDRIIENFDLSIYPADKKEDENCFIWACPSYDTEIDFKNIREKDTVAINFFISKERFHKLADLIDAKKIANASVMLSGVDGFYSRWSPSITTRDIKVLTENHEIENLEGVEERILKVERVSEFSLSYQTINELNPKPNRKPIDFYRQFDEESEEPKLDDEEYDLKQIQIPLDSPYKNIEQLIDKHIKSIKRFLWLIAILLIFILAK